MKSVVLSGMCCRCVDVLGVLDMCGKDQSLCFNNCFLKTVIFVLICPFMNDPG